MSRVKKTEKKATDIMDEADSIEMQEVGVAPAVKQKATTGVKLGVYPVNSDVILPMRASDKSSCYDLHSYLKGSLSDIKSIGVDGKQVQNVAAKDGIKLYPHTRTLVPTGLRFEIPDGYDVRVYSRSGLSFKEGVFLTNSVGVIDNDYRGEVFVSLYNATDKEVKINHGDRIAQFELNKLDSVELEVLGEYDVNKTKRSEGGFGSTGV